MCLLQESVDWILSFLGINSERENWYLSGQGFLRKSTTIGPESEDPWLSRSRYSPLMGSLESIHMTGPITPRYLLWKRASQWPHSTIQAMTSGSPTWFTWFNPRKDLEIAKKDWRTAYPLTSCPRNIFLLPSFWSMLVSSKLQAILPYK